MNIRLAAGVLFLAAVSLPSAFTEEQRPPDWPTPFECPRYTVSVNRITLHHAEKTVSKYTLHIYLKFQDRANDDKLGAIQMLPDSIEGISDAGPLKVVSEYENLSRMYKHTGGLSFTAEVPATAKTIQSLDCKFLMVYPEPEEKVVWQLPLETKGETKTFRNFTFTLDDAAIGEKEATFEYSYKMPVTSDQAKNWPRAFMDTHIDLADGSQGHASGGSSPNHGHLRLGINKSPPKTFAISFVPGIRQEVVSFSLKDLKLPVTEPRAKPENEGPPGPRRIDIEGTTLELTNVDLYKNIDPKKNAIRIFTSHVPKNFKNSGEFIEIKNVHATDDMDRDLLSFGGPFTHWPAADFKLPDNNVRRIKSYRGVYSMLTVDEVEKIVIDLPPASAKFDKPIESGPINVTAVTYGADYVNVSFDVNLAALPSPEWEKLRGGSQSTGKNSGIVGMDFDLLDNADQPCQCIGTGLSNKSGWHQVKANYTDVPKEGAKLVVFFPKKGHAAQLPFEFKDIDLPVFLGKEKLGPEKTEF